jgi:ABC-2 type transport system permease protein
MNRALWKKAFDDVRTQLLVSSIILAGFSWIFMWLISLVKMEMLATVMQALPGFFQRMLGIPLPDLVTPAGRISIVFVHIITLIVCLGWAVGRGSDPICGEVGRGTLDLLVSLPIWRPTLIIISAAMAALGTAVLALSILFGIALGLATTDFQQELSLVWFIPGTINLFSMVFCMTGITTFISSIIKDRWRTISLAAGFFLVSLIIEVVSKLWPAGAWLHYCTFLSAFQPQTLTVFQGNSLVMQTTYNAVLLGIGLFCYASGIAIFSRRDIPASR